MKRPLLRPDDLADACIALLTDGSLDSLLRIDDGSWWTPEQLEIWSAAYGDLAESLHQAMRQEIAREAEQVVEAYQAEQRRTAIDYVADRQEKIGEAKGLAIGLINDYRRSQRTPEENTAKAEQDNDDLFGTASERSGETW